MVELIFFTPKAPPFEPTRNQPYVAAIIASNLICIIFHAFFIRPEAGEETRGYLHGGLFIDFIGQIPVSVPRLLSFDLLIFFVDIVMLALIIERVKITGSSTPSTGSNTGTIVDANSEAVGSQPQDHDAEERGVLRQEDSDEVPPLTDDNAGSSPNSSIDEEVEEERTTLLADPAEIGSPSAVRGGHPMDSFAAGEVVLVNTSFFGTMRDQWRYSNAPARPTAGFVPTPETATFLRQRFGLQVGADGRIDRVNT
ncbi:uncharacterized protein N7529_006394 [Penicillium soppii]|uniref:uncharacterized protein n=1 Tax=Penicillium soppii TaxID=69789 RepID=UPI002548E8C4|nr:uncharacterized protein N7529_006394 [Penicillium soppii]KAJ5864478.1 hypothetical protein N7529_006394 [Penicillium soppii]